MFAELFREELSDTCSWVVKRFEQHLNSNTRMSLKSGRSSSSSSSSSMCISLGNRVSAPVAAAALSFPLGLPSLCHGLGCPPPQPPPPLPPSPTPPPPPPSTAQSVTVPLAVTQKQEAIIEVEVPHQGDGGSREEQVHGRPRQCLQSYQVSLDSTKVPPPDMLLSVNNALDVMLPKIIFKMGQR